MFLSLYNVPLYFAVCNVVKIVQYYLRNSVSSVYSTVGLCPYFILDKNYRWIWASMTSSRGYAYDSASCDGVFE